MTLRRQRAARLRCLMTDRPAFREFGKTAEKWRDLAEKRHDYFRELHRSGRWRIYYNDQEFVAHLGDIARLCDCWAMIVAQMQARKKAPEAEHERRSAA